MTEKTKAEKRPYILSTKGEQDALIVVMAFSRAQALRHLAEKSFAARPASSTEIVNLMRAGIEIETAGGHDQQELELDPRAEAAPVVFVPAVHSEGGEA